MNDNTYNIQLIAEHYDVHPQAILWMLPIFQDDSERIIDFEYVYSNNEGLKYLNLTREQFTGLLVSNSPTLSGNFREAVMAEMTEVYETGKDSETTVFNPALNKYARVLRNRLRNGVLTVVQDITKEKQIIKQLKEKTVQLEEQTRLLQEQKALLDNILKNSSNGISVSQVLKDDTGKVVDALTIMANDAAIKYIGFPKDVYLTKRATEIEPAVMHSPYYQACIKTLETGEPFMMQYQMHSTGRWLELTVSRLDENHLIQIFTDVTPFKEVQLQLEIAATTLKTIFDSAQTGMVTFVPEYNDQNEIVEFRFIMVNATVAAYLGQKVEDLEGERVCKWFPNYHKNGLFDMYKLAFETGEPQRRDTIFEIKGNEYHLDIKCIKIGDQVLVTLTDHTTLRNSQLQLEQTVAALKRTNNYLQEFAYAASHDLKEPLRKILIYSARLRKTLQTHMTESEASLFEKIQTSANRMERLVDDLLEFSHLGNQHNKLEPVDLNEKLQKVLTDLELTIEEKKAQVIIADRLPVIHGSRRQLQQLFQNLISNGLKYSKPDIQPIINISTRIVNENDPILNNLAGIANRSYHLVSVSDNGIGFEQQYADQIFEMFKRLHGKSQYSGTGIGLAIARKVLENHNGFIWAEGEHDKGATFNILFPVI